MRPAFFVIIINGAARLSSFRYVGHGFRGRDWCRYRTGHETPEPSPTESKRPHVAFAPLAAVLKPHEADRRSPVEKPGQGGYWHMLGEMLYGTAAKYPNHMTATPRAPIGT